MVNRFSGRGLSLAGLHAAGAAAVTRAAVGTLEQLEGRRLLSGAANVVDVNWLGHTVSAIQNSYVVQVKRGTDFNAIAARQGFTGVETLGPGGFYSFETTRTPAQVQKWGNQAKGIAAVQPNLVVKPQTTVPNDPQFTSGAQWNLDNFGQPIAGISGVPVPGVPGTDINATHAWDITTGSKSVVVAVLDTGLDITHPDLINNVWTNPAEAAANGIDDDRNGFADDVHGWNAFDQNNDLTDEVGHGTHVAGIVGAQGNNGIGVSGVNWNVTLLPVKVLGLNGGTTASVIRGLQYITTLKHQWVSSGGTAGADITVANLSLGTDFLFPFSRVEAEAFQVASDAGIIMTVAAGNGGADGIGDNIDLGFSFPGKFSLNIPNVISVASLTHQNVLSIFSDFGPTTVQVAAPGEGIISTFSRDVLIDTNSDGAPDTRGGIEYQVESGTSQASPHVAGIIALMKAANPAATPDQLRRALFSSVDVVPALSANLSGQPSVTTSGRVDAFKAVLAIQNQFQQSDAATRGNWQGFGSNRAYGREAAYVVGESTSFPAGVTVLGGNTTVFADSTRDVSALQKITAPTDRIAAGLTSAGPLTVDLNFADPATGAAQTKLVTLYVADYGKVGRGLGVEVIDPETGASLTGGFPQVVTNFAGGQYLTYQITGHTQIKITPLNGQGAILSGVFIDPVVTRAQALVGTDATTRGNFQSTFGSQGNFVVGQSTRYPSFVVVNTANAATLRAKVPARDAASQLVTGTPGGRTVRATGYLATTSAMVLDMNFTDGQVHRTSFYAADFGNKGRAERFELIDANTGAVLAKQDLFNFAGGKYVTFDMSGHQLVRITRLAGPNAVLSGVFFDAPPGGTATFRGIDATTRGTWKAVYGSRAALVIDAGHVPTATPTTLALGNEDEGNVLIATVGGTPQILANNSTNAGAPQKVSSAGIGQNDRVIGRLASRTGIITDFYFSDNQTRQVAIYMLDSDTKNQRAQIVTVSDPTTGAVLAQQLVTNFSNGKYFVFDAKGSVRVTVARVAGPSAVVNAYFVD
jgi:subtilisin family serine protease